MGGGGGVVTRQRLELPIRVHSTSVTAAANGCKDGNASDFVSTVPLGVSTKVFRGVAVRGTEGGTELGAVIN